jgi:drug/metabolite transporter (DMT)-like permease
MATEQSSLFRGALYALATAALLATQAPLSLLGAKRLSAAEFICVTEMVLLLCVPFMLRTQRSREHFRGLISSVSNLGKFGVLLLIGLIGIVLYAFGLGRGHPIVISAVLNLDPFWAAIIAYLIAGKKIPTSLWTFTLCLAVAAGTILATGFGRVLYQKALTVTDNNNGFVSIFFLLIPAFTCLLSLWMSRWISELKFTVGPLFFLGLGLIAAPILVFLWQSQKGSSDRSAIQEMDMHLNMSVSDPV